MANKRTTWNQKNSNFFISLTLFVAHVLNVTETFDSPFPSSLAHTPPLQLWSSWPFFLFCPSACIISHYQIPLADYIDEPHDMIIHDMLHNLIAESMSFGSHQICGMVRCTPRKRWLAIDMVLGSECHYDNNNDLHDGGHGNAGHGLCHDVVHYKKWCNEFKIKGGAPNSN